jgi:hypothetical protein
VVGSNSGFPTKKTLNTPTLKTNKMTMGICWRQHKTEYNRTRCLSEDAFSLMSDSEEMVFLGTTVLSFWCSERCGDDFEIH